MMQLFALVVKWDGTELIAEPQMRDGWRYMATEGPPRLKRISLMCTGIEDVTQFELGLFLAMACRGFTDAWEGQALSQVTGLELVHEAMGEPPGV